MSLCEGHGCASPFPLTRMTRISLVQAFAIFKLVGYVAGDEGWMADPLSGVR